MNKIIIPTGYMGTGSSAITDLVSEFKGYENALGSFEYIFMHCPNGLFDLEDKLLVGNNAIRSDEAIHAFRDMMKELYKSKFWWPGNYKKNLSENYMKIVDEYLENLIQYRPQNYWYMQQRMTPKLFVKSCVKRFVSIISANHIVLKQPLRYKPMEISLVQSEEFYEVSKRFLNNLFIELGLDKQNLVLDQLLLPFNLWRMEHYFDDNAECFVVDRDPRDVFIVNKYVWTKQGATVPYPTDAKMFCEYYRRLRAVEKMTDNTHIHRFHFEDLIYHYEESVQRVCDILKVSKEDQVRAKTTFVPEKSIENTQLFRVEKYAEEMKIIEQELRDYLYEFPYERSVNMKAVF